MFDEFSFFVFDILHFHFDFIYNIFEVNETNKMIEQENLDVRTITMGISLLDCIDSDLAVLNEKIYKKLFSFCCFML